MAIRGNQLLRYCFRTSPTLYDKRIMEETLKLHIRCLNLDYYIAYFREMSLLVLKICNEL